MAQINRESRRGLHSGKVENHHKQDERKKKGGGIHNAERGQDRAPLIGLYKSRSCTPIMVKQRSASAVVAYEADTMRKAPSGKAPHLERTLTTVTEIDEAADVLQLRRSRSAPLYRLAQANRFELKTSPARISYGIAGYDTNRPRSFTSGQSDRSDRRSNTNLNPEWTARFRESRMRIRDTCVRLFSRLRVST